EAKAPTEEKRRAKPPKPKDRFLLVDCYNLIFADEGLRSIAERDFALARDTLVRMLCDYAAFVGTRVIAVFDAYRVKRGEGSVQRFGAVTVVYTKEAQTADAYIEQVTYRTARDNEVRVVTSDMVEQYVILGNGALRVSVKEFMRELADTASDIRSILDSQARRSGK
ncbi:MAG: NYN domain-containing protein, partial [Clostridia bacterium]|nr:NYN domain-containing protein [Clostridia bacterium]